MVTVLAIGPKVRWFKPGRGRWIIKAEAVPLHAMEAHGGEEV
jgi:hypothetical protein